jgi:hypothetical protein
MGPTLYLLLRAQEDCRRRRTPESVRFLGRRVYAGLVVVLVTVMVHGLKPRRIRRIREALQVDSRTVKRWRQWWLDSFRPQLFMESRPGPVSISPGSITCCARPRLPWADPTIFLMLSLQASRKARGPD